MAADDSRNQGAARSVSLGGFDAEETVKSWVRLATESIGDKPNDVRLQLTIDLKTVVTASGLTQVKLIESLVTLVGTAAVETQLMINCAKPGGGYTGNGSGSGSTSTTNTVDPAKELSRSVTSGKPSKSSKSSKRSGRK